MISEINVTPFVDVMLVLLIIFMVTAPMMQQGIDVDLPETTTQNLRIRDEPLVLSIDKAGKYFLGRREIAPAELAEKLAAKREQGTIQQAAPKGSKGSLGAAENANKRGEAQLRTEQAKLDANLQYKLTKHAVLTPWAVCHSMFILNHFQPGFDGKTVHARILGEEYKSAMITTISWTRTAAPRICSVQALHQPRSSRHKKARMASPSCRTEHDAGPWVMSMVTACWTFWRRRTIRVPFIFG